ncbi:MAG TPA: DoxX family protein [Bradyrhizobium sp.]|jgi:putative oxidoreductase|uniref:DoxX family protein n=1 Tax=Bradyrhizobium sp. TaxID=376 RepID=UPI002B476E2C|nr:DoxX family protein [Bradyrhizobium sp.]HKO70756.1 DoxX family protein [Bradyrhizobium sp.]
MNSDSLTTVWAPRALGVLSVLRIFTGLDLLQHGTGKILGFPIVPMFANVQINSLAGVGGLIELIGGFLFMIGLFTRPVAFILSGFTAAAYFIAHAGKGFYPVLNGGELAALFCFVFLYFAVAGGGVWSADALIKRA